MLYRISATFEVEAPEGYTRAIEKFIHDCVQGDVGLDADGADGKIEIVGACGGRAEPVKQP